MSNPTRIEPTGRSSAASARARRSSRSSTSSGCSTLGKTIPSSGKAPDRRQLADPPQQGVEVAHRGLEVEPGRTVEAQRRQAVRVAPVGFRQRRRGDRHGEGGHLVTGRDRVLAIEHHEGRPARPCEPPLDHGRRQLEAFGEVRARQTEPVEHPRDGRRPAFDRLARHRGIGRRRREVRLLTPVAKRQVRLARGEPLTQRDPVPIAIGDGLARGPAWAEETFVPWPVTRTTPAAARGRFAR